MATDAALSDTALISLKQPGFAVIDSDLFAWLNQWKWSLSPEGYAYRYERISGKARKIYMHRVINQTPLGFYTDHNNGIKLDNRRQNLRTATRCQNNHNSSKHQRGQPHSSFKGVWKNPKGNRWVAQISAFHRKIHLGTFDTETEAAAAYNSASNRLHGSFTKPNAITQN